MRYAAALLLLGGCALFAPAGPDLALHDLRVTESVVAGAPVEVQLRISLRRLEAREVGLALAIVGLDGKAAFTQQHVARLPGPGTHALEMTLRPPAVGNYRLVVTAPTQPEETDPENNAASAPFAVRAREPRVLYVEHPPRYEYRFLKNALVRDSTLLVQTFLMSADEGFPQEHTRETGHPRFREPLKALPASAEELQQYEVVILGDVDPSRLPPGLCDALERFVERGGGLVVIAGLLATPHAWKGTPLGRMLPVEPAERVAEEVREEPFGYRLTGQGRASRLTRFPSLAADAGRNVEQWEDRDGKRDGLVGVRWFSPVRAKESAAILVEVGPVAKTWHPLFVTARAGAGRVFFSATDETWLWRYLTGDQPWFYPFWRQVVDWAAGAE